jgi:hypothetical protein
MKNITFTLNTVVSTNDTIMRISNLLTSEHVKFQADLNSVRSKEIPLPLLSFDKRLYTKRNWVGINPFIFVSEINFFIKESHFQQTQIDITICQRRAIVMYLSFIFLLFFVLIEAALDNHIYPNILTLLLIIAVIMPILVHLFIFEFCIKGLIKSEIKDAIR